MLSNWITACTTGVAAVLVLSCAMVRGFSQAPPTFIQALHQRHIETTRLALIAALRNPDKEVRGLAAAELADEKVTAALPMILRAAQEETDPQTKVNIASAATWMGSDEGVRMLKVACANRSYSSWVRVGAARGVFDRGDHGCFPALVELVRSDDRGARVEGLSAISQIHDKTEEETKTVVSLVAGALGDSDVGVRLEACDALRWVNRAEGIAGLRRALLTEKEEIVRSQMDATLKYLLKGHPAQ